MRVALPHVGKLYIPFRAAFNRLGVELIVPPTNSRRSLTLGTRHSPEGLCLPFKLTLGNMIEAAEMGADTIMMPGGYGICRLGYYAKAQEQILSDLGYKVEIVQFGVSEHKLRGLLSMIKRCSGNAAWPRLIDAFGFSLAKLNALDRIERLAQKIRPVEQVKGTANRLLAAAVKAIDEAAGFSSLRRVRHDYLTRLKAVPTDSTYKPLVVGISGEFYVVLEPFSNLDVESELGKMGVEVRRRLFLSRWTSFTMFLNRFGLDDTARLHRAARPYLRRDVGGEGWETVGEKVLHAGEYDGIVHLAPFTCMPEIVAENIMSSTREKIPVLTILCDEQITKTGMLTRLEAFVDLLQRRRRASNNNHRVTLHRRVNESLSGH